MDRVPLAVLVESWANEGAGLAPRDIGALMLTSRAWRDALGEAGTAERLLHAHVRTRLPQLQELAGPALSGRPFAHLLVRGALRAELVLRGLDAMLAAARREPGAPYRASLWPLADGSVWRREEKEKEQESWQRRERRTSYGFWALACLHVVAKGLLALAGSGARPRTDLRPWALLAVFRYAEHLLRRDCSGPGAAPPPRPIVDALCATAADVRSARWHDARADPRVHRQLSSAASGVARALQRHKQRAQGAGPQHV